MNAFLRALLPASIPKLLKSPKTREMIVAQIVFWRQKGVPLSDLAKFLEMSPRHISRWIKKREESESASSLDLESRRPKTSPGQTPKEIQCVLRSLAAIYTHLSIAELARLFNTRFKVLLETHGLERLSAKTVGKYCSKKDEGVDSEQAKDSRSLRGNYQYPRPMSMAWIDTSYFKVAGIKVHIIVAMEAFSRIALAGEAVIQDSSESVASVITEALDRAPGIRALVRDRGTPYLNTHITDLLADRGCLPIDAHPYFPIDKAALERFFGTAKPWLRDAFARLEEEWGNRKPSQEEVLSSVRSALQVYLRAYNFIPQPYLEAKCPFDRLEKALKNTSTKNAQFDELQKLAHEREDKAKILNEVCDGLQIKVNPIQRLRDFATIDKIAIRKAFEICFEKLVIQRDQSIRLPYRYLWAVAKRINRQLLQARANARRRKRNDDTRRRDQESLEEKLRSEQESWVSHPEEHFSNHLDVWLRSLRLFGTRNRISGEAKLRETMAGLAQKFGAAFDGHIQSIVKKIPFLLERLPGRCGNPETATKAFLDLATASKSGQSQPGFTPALDDSRPSCNNIQNLVQRALAAIQVPHVEVTNVPSQHT